jgi:hypothetical protein
VALSRSTDHSRRAYAVGTSEDLLGRGRDPPTVNRSASKPASIDGQHVAVHIAGVRGDEESDRRCDVFVRGPHARRIDRSLAERDSVVLEAGSHERSVRMKAADLMHLTGAQVDDISRQDR